MPRVKKEILPPDHCTSVKDYEQSKYWAAKSKALLDDKAAVCAICGRTRWQFLPRAKRWKKIRFCSHHITYKDCPNETKEQVMLLCWTCHDLFHLLLRLEKWGGIFSELGKIARKVFFYEGIDTFKAW